MNWDGATITAIVAALLAALPGIFAFLSQRRKDKASAIEAGQKAVSNVIEMLTARLDAFEQDLAAERQLRKQAEDNAAEATRQLAVTKQSLREATESKLEALRRIEQLEIELNGMKRAQQKQAEGSADREERVTHLEEQVTTIQHETMPPIEGELAEVKTELVRVKTELEKWRSGEKTRRTGHTGPL